jgi:hypothetical protein
MPESEELVTNGGKLRNYIASAFERLTKGQNKDDRGITL